MTMKIDKRALRAAATKLHKLRLEDVGGRKERPAATVASALDKALPELGSVEGVEYILRHGIRYYLDESSLTAATQQARREALEEAAGAADGMASSSAHMLVKVEDLDSVEAKEWGARLNEAQQIAAHICALATATEINTDKEQTNE